MDAIEIIKDELNNYLNNCLNEQTYKVYHGTNQEFDRFDFNRATQGIVWFTDNLESIKKGEHGGVGNKIIMTRYVTINNPAGWEEYNKYGLQQLQDMGYDGVILPDSDGTVYFVFSNDAISKTEPRMMNESRSEYLSWKRKNVTLRGMKEIGQDNEVYGSFGKGLYSTPLSNRSMAREYGDVYFVVNGKPKNPKVVENLNLAEIWIQNLVNGFCKKNNKAYDPSFFEENTSIEREMISLGYDGLFIRGREMVNYTPENVMYFKSEFEVEDYFERKHSN